MKESLRGRMMIRLSRILAVCIGCLLLAACGQTATQQMDAYLVQVGSRTLTVSQFNEVFEISKTAYSHSDIMDAKIVADIKLRLLNQMIEEMMLLEKAAAAGIGISEVELEGEIRKIKADYPDDIFEEMLLEAAVSFEAWKKRLKNQLIAKKYIQVELASKVTITSDEVGRYFAKHYPDQARSGPDEKTPGITEEMVLRMLKNQKVQATYTEWMKQNRRTMTINIDSRQWDKITKKQS